MKGALPGWLPGRKARAQLPIINPRGLLLLAALRPALGGPGAGVLGHLAGGAARPHGGQALLLALLAGPHLAVALHLLLHQLGQLLLWHSCSRAHSRVHSRIFGRVHIGVHSRLHIGAHSRVHSRVDIGFTVGFTVGSTVGLTVGCTLGFTVGSTVGCT